MQSPDDNGIKNQNIKELLMNSQGKDRNHIKKVKKKFEILSAPYAEYDLIQDAIRTLNNEDLFAYLNEYHSEISRRIAVEGLSGDGRSEYNTALLEYVDSLLKHPPNIDPTPENNINLLLLEIFPTAHPDQIQTLIENLTGEDKYVSLFYKGQKKSLWFKLGKLRDFDISRAEIARVFSKYVKWQQYPTSSPKDISYEEINRKMAGKGAN